MPHPRRGAALSLLVLTSLLLAGTLLRFHDLDGKIYWHDEAHTSLRVFGHTLSELEQTLFTGRVVTVAEVQRFQRLAPQETLGQTLAALERRPEHAPLYYLAARLWAPHFNDPVVGTRSLSALFGVLLIPAMFWLAWELFGSRTTAGITAALAAVSPLHLLYAQQAREYALWALLTALSCALLLRAVRSGRALAWLGYGASIAISLYADLLAVWVIVAHGIYLLSIRRELGRSALPFYVAAVVTAGLLLSPWLALLLNQLKDIQHVTAWMHSRIPLGQLLHGWGLNLNRLFFDGPHASWLIPFSLLVAGLALYTLTRATPRRIYAFPITLIVLTAAPILLPDLLAGGRRSLETRYLMPTGLGIELCVAWLINALVADTGRARRTTGWMLAAVLAVGGMTADLAIARSETWWTKSVSQHNGEVARLINQTERPLLISSFGDINPGEILSLSYLLQPKVHLLLVDGAAAARIPPGYGPLFVLNPSGELRHSLEERYLLRPVHAAGRLWQATPRSAPPYR
jgi:uncharacterized membrane protein